MRHIEALSEHHMVAAFLKAEIGSERFGPGILALIERNRCDRQIIDSPNVDDAKQNACRRRLLGDFRGYQQDRELFEYFPADVSWHRYALAADELAAVRYVDYSYWNELSGGSRRPADAVANIRAGVVVFGQPNRRFLAAARALQGGARFPELILVGTAPGAELVVLEGHVRLTAYMLAPDHIPADLTAIIGFSPALQRWMAIPPAKQKEPCKDD
jgi:hypothetical protein